MKPDYILEPPHPNETDNPFGLDLGDEISVIITTVSTIEQAKELSNKLVQKKLVACVQLEEIHSIYRWQDEVNSEDEIRIVIKTTIPRSDEVIYFLKQYHPYDTPEIILTNFKVDKKYSSWCSEVTRLK